MIEIDGSLGEGGGQILRTAVSFSAAAQKPCRVFNIREKRKNPGLAIRHLAGLLALEELCGGSLEGGFLGSKEIKFFPGEIKTQDLKIKIEGAGSIILILQTLLIPALFSSLPLKIKFIGGATDTFFSPSIDYFRFVFLPMIEKIIAALPDLNKENFERPWREVNISKRGFYPEGGAIVEAGILPLGVFRKITKPFLFENRGELKKILIISGASDSLKEKKIAEKQISGVRQTPLFCKKAGLPIETKTEYYDTLSQGSQITIIGDFEKAVIGADSFWRLGQGAEEVGKEAAMDFFKEAKADFSLDKYLCDQILPYIALLTKSARLKTSKITEHTKTNIWVIEKFIKGKFEIKENMISWKSH